VPSQAPACDERDKQAACYHLCKPLSIHVIEARPPERPTQLLEYSTRSIGGQCPTTPRESVAVLSEEWVAALHPVVHCDGPESRNAAAARAGVFQVSDPARANDHLPPPW